jgi:glyoxylase-like metal-dependent hydrolase (beta-lactamase superfamily II)
MERAGYRLVETPGDRGPATGNRQPNTLAAMPTGWTELGDGIFVRRYRSLDLNVGAVIGEDGIVVIDSRANHVQGRELAHDLEPFGLPVRWLINTHHHWDHTFGNAMFAAAAIWGHTRCADALRTRGETMRAMVKDMAPDHAAAFDEVVITPPQFTFSSEVTVTFGGRQIEMRHLGRGHTDNDIVIVVADAGVVFAGDLVEQGAPPAFNDAFTLEWPDTDAALLELASGTVVPGHGATVDSTFVAGQHAEIAEVARLARERHAEGMTATDAAKQGGPYPFEVMETAFVRAWGQIQ